MKKVFAIMMAVMTIAVAGCRAKTAEKEKEFEVYASFSDKMWCVASNGDGYTFKEVYEVICKEDGQYVYDFKTKDLEPYYYCNETKRLYIENTEVNVFAPFEERFTLVAENVKRVL